MHRNIRQLAVVAAPVLFAGSAAVLGLSGSASAATTPGSLVSAVTSAAMVPAQVTPPVDIRTSACPGNMVENQVSGACVVALQDLLINWGYGGDLGPSGADGGFGPDTENAVKSFQTAARIGVDGQVGPQTKAALYSLANPLANHTTAVNGYDDNTCLDADANTAGRNGQKIQGWQCIAGDANQEWNVYLVPYSSNRMLVSAVDGECLDADTNTAAENGQIIQGWACNGQFQQQWVSKPNYAAANANSGKCLDADTNTVGVNGQKIQGWACNGSPEQSWLPGSN
ncbi:RICIN domain-containing protein [Streptacidiphilus anmyonensis]|uniref:RICIN domain-containing protein n=1 Tax=Streptacidiphilus anmyonensis TaxID=405782 RepID=UPI0009FF1BED|nr:ricin-type beta-trefoil lectin domain protein [Streptacidiphilus anmyonensis]